VASASIVGDIAHPRNVAGQASRRKHRRRIYQCGVG
jgi:hypothetical protein